MRAERVLVVEPEPLALCQGLEIDALAEHISVVTDLSTADQACRMLEPEVVVVSVDENISSAARLLREIRAESDDERAVIVVREGRSPAATARLVGSGAIDVFDVTGDEAVGRFREAFTRSLKILEARAQVVARSSMFHEAGHPLYLGSSPEVVRIGKLLLKAASSDASVLITGENGTGKEIAANLIHRFSDRSEQAMVPLNCAAIPSGLVESELFGHVKGAFTGALQSRDGVAKTAHSSTLFLDEIGEMELAAQSKLLRFAQGGQFSPVGSSEILSSDVRLISATNKDPRALIEQGKFREDLFYRLNVIELKLPPLRGRGGDIDQLAIRFLERACFHEGKHFEGFSAETLELLRAYPWPGNVRELQNVIRSVVVLNDGELVIPSMLPVYLVQYSLRRELDPHTQATDWCEACGEEVVEPEEFQPLELMIDTTIARALDACDGNVSEAARRLGVSPSTIYRRRGR